MFEFTTTSTTVTAWPGNPPSIKTSPGFMFLILIFFLLLTPLAFLSKIFKAQTDFKKVNDSNTMFVEVNKTFSKRSYERSW